MTEPEWQSHGFIPGFPVIFPVRMTDMNASMHGSTTVIRAIDEQINADSVKMAETEEVLKGLGEELDRSRRLALAALWVSSLGLAVFLFDLLVILIRH